MLNIKKIAFALITSLVFISTTYAKFIVLDSSNPKSCYAAITDKGDKDLFPVVLIHNSDFAVEEKITLASLHAVAASNPDRDFYVFDFAYGNMETLEKCLGHSVKFVAGPVIEMFIRLESPQTKKLILSNPVSATAGLSISVENMLRIINLENGKKINLKRKASKYLLIK